VVTLNVGDIMFGQLTNNGPSSAPATWHVVCPQGDSWATACTAISARPGMRVINMADEPGPTLCKLVRCQRAVETWRASRTLV
jgi:hypothetical protein